MRRSDLLLSAGILGLVYLINVIAGAIFMFDSVSSSEEVAFNIVVIIICIPHFIFVILAVIFNWVGWIMNLRWAILVAGIMYAVSMVLMFVLAIFVLLQMIFCFVVFGKMKKLNVELT